MPREPCCTAEPGHPHIYPRDTPGRVTFFCSGAAGQVDAIPRGVHPNAWTAVRSGLGGLTMCARARPAAAGLRAGWASGRVGQRPGSRGQLDAGIPVRRLVAQLERRHRCRTRSPRPLEHPLPRKGLATLDVDRGGLGQPLAPEGMPDEGPPVVGAGCGIEPPPHLGTVCRQVLGQVDLVRDVGDGEDVPRTPRRGRASPWRPRSRHNRTRPRSGSSGRSRTDAGPGRMPPGSRHACRARSGRGGPRSRAWRERGRRASRRS